MKNKNQLIIKFIVWAGKLSAASCGVAFEKQTPDSPHLKNCVQSPQAQRISSTSLRKEKGGKFRMSSSSCFIKKKKKSLRTKPTKAILKINE